MVPRGVTTLEQVRRQRWLIQVHLVALRRQVVLGCRRLFVPREPLGQRGVTRLQAELRWRRITAVVEIDRARKHLIVDVGGTTEARLVREVDRGLPPQGDFELAEVVRTSLAEPRGALEVTLVGQEDLAVRVHRVSGARRCYRHRCR